MSRRQILLIEDEQDIADLLCLHLSDLDASVEHANDGVQGLALALQKSWDLILMDLSLPRCDGLAICQQVRQGSPATAIIMVTARSSELERVRGLDAGADDYITKPFSITELIARVNALFRRLDALRAIPAGEVVSTGDMVLNLNTHQTLVDGQEVALTAKEFDLLLQFVRSPGRVFKRAELLESVWGHSHEGYLHTVNTHINRLRAKVEPEPRKPRYITTVWGVGYRLAT